MEGIYNKKIMSGIQYFAAALAITGSFLVTSPVTMTRRWAFITWVAANSLWMTYAIATGQPGVAIQAFAFLIANAVGLFRLGARS